ncbi:DUF6538 domain-containing protein [Paraburkholderia sp. 40]|uniref:DUF6538 domain-containing protein n=1 Tax=Paraburkholderia sp. 40 TaxID=2991059 RepID=UPI003D20518F
MCTHLIKRGSRYYIRRRVPLDLVSILGKSEITKALRTSDRAEAITRCRLEGVRLDAEWSALRAASQAKHAITHASETARTTVRKREAEDRERAAEEDREYYFRYVKDEGVEEEERERFEDDAARQAAVLREAHKLAGIAPPADTPSNTSARISKPAKSPRNTSGRLLPDVIDAWARERQPQARTVQIAERCARRFREMVGPVLVASIERTHVVSFKDALLSSGQTAVNTDKILTMLSTVLSYAHDQGWLASNPAKGVKVGARSNAKAARLPFDVAALKLIFGSPVYTEHARPAGGAGEASYWLPLLALYTGARLEELAQLSPADVSETPYTDAQGARRSCWTIRITDEGAGQGVKTATSRRRLPIHPDLIALGFITYAQSIGGPRLFPMLKADTDGREGALWGKWFGKWIRKLGVTDPRMVFHSFRHLLKHTMREAGVTEEVSDAITGHASASVGRRYGATLYPLAPLVDAMQRYRIHGMTLPQPWSNSGE